MFARFHPSPMSPMNVQFKNMCESKEFSISLSKKLDLSITFKSIGNESNFGGFNLRFITSSQLIPLNHGCILISSASFKYPNL